MVDHRAPGKRNVTVTFPDELLTRIDVLADERHLSRSVFINQIVVEALERIRPVGEFRLTD